jgi:hypothetical protein
MNNLTQRRQGAKIRKEEVPFSLCALKDSVPRPRDEMLLLFKGVFHSFPGFTGETLAPPLYRMAGLRP